MKITFKDRIIETQDNIKVRDLLKEEIQNNKYNVMGCIVNNEYQNLDFELSKDSNIELIDMTNKEGMKIYRRTLIYILGKAFGELYPEALITVNYQLAHAMFCEIDNMETTDEMLEKISKKMKEIIQKDLKIEKRIMNREEAKKFYEETKTRRGKLQYDLESNNEIVMYYCEDYYNYCYGMIAANTGSLNIFKLEKYEDGFLVKYPSSKNPAELPNDKESNKLSLALNEYDDLHKILKINTVEKLNRTVEENKIKDIIMIDEALHEKKIANIADEILKRKDVKMILIAGPSSSGKTTFAQRLGIQLRINGIKPVTISVDNYFVERKDTPKDENGNYNFECIEAIDMDLFNDHLTRLLNGEEVEMPQFDFKVGTKRYKGKMLKLHEDEVLVIEGIHCLNDRLTSKIQSNQKFKIYISDLTVLNMDYYNRISSTDNRLIRRIVRDYQFRGYSALHTLKTWKSVNDGEEQNIFPFQESADAMFNTSLIYELGALKEIALPLLEEITPEEKEYAEARRLVNMLKYFKTIDSKLIPSNSLLKEFLGGGDFEY
ncbi:MAG: nucleoside kinase [Clostridia bacterium]|nr:nucleoside kinase [Clostridia bacterium]